MSRRIFRPAALQRYNENLGKIVLPRYASPPWPAVLAALAALLIIATAILWSVQTPVYAGGPGVVVQAPQGFAGESEPVLAVFFAPELGSRLRVGQRALVEIPGLKPAGLAIGEDHSVAAVQREVLAPAALRGRYRLDSSTGLLVAGPTVVALIRLDAPAEVFLGSVGEVQIEVGTVRGLALLPGIGRFFRVESLAPR